MAADAGTGALTGPLVGAGIGLSARADPAAGGGVPARPLLSCRNVARKAPSRSRTRAMLSPRTTMEVMLIDQLAPLAVCLGISPYRFMRAKPHGLL
ncbi:hypothetical protein GCM10009734_47280 [Nonomuraea bangladeshensis]